MAVSRLQVNRNRIVDSGLDSPLGKMRHQAIPHGMLGAADHILVIHMGRPGGLGRQSEFRNSSEQLIV